MFFGAQGPNFSGFSRYFVKYSKESDKEKKIKKMESLADNINLQIVEIINQISKIEDALNMYIEKVDNF